VLFNRGSTRKSYEDRNIYKVEEKWKYKSETKLNYGKHVVMLVGLE